MKRWPCLDFARPLKRARWEPGPKADEIRVHAESDVPVLDRTSFPFAGQPSVQHCSDRVDLLSYCQIAGQEPYLVLPPGAYVSRMATGSGRTPAHLNSARKTRT